MLLIYNGESCVSVSAKILTRTKLSITQPIWCFRSRTNFLTLPHHSTAHQSTLWTKNINNNNNNNITTTTTTRTTSTTTTSSTTTTITTTITTTTTTTTTTITTTTTTTTV